MVHTSTPFDQPVLLNFETEIDLLLGYISRSSDTMSSLVTLLFVLPRLTYTSSNEYCNMSTTPSPGPSSESLSNIVNPA